MPLLSPRSSAPRRPYWLAALVFAGVFLAFAKVTNTNPPTNSAQTSFQNEDLQTRVYEAMLDSAAQKVAAFSLSTYGRAWKLQSQQRVSPDEIRLTFQVPVIVFTDILTVSIKGHRSDEEVEVNVESHSQIGKGDFGENRRHVKQILSELDKTLG